jgi:hypothetical protein
MSWTESELRIRSIEERLEDILDEEDFSDFTEDQRHLMLDRLEVFGERGVRELIGDWKEGSQ